MSLSSGSPGSIRFSIPSRPAISIAEKARYGLHEGSGERNSIRFAFGLGEYMGMRIAAERLRELYARFTGASKPGTSRLYELVVGLQIAASARVLENPAHVVERHLRQPRIPLAGEERLAALPHRLVRV